MASLMENLIDILDKEVTEYKAMLELSNKKTPILIKGDIEALQQITEEEQNVVDRISNLDRKRAEAMKDVANVLNKDVHTLKLSAIIDLLEKRPEEQKKLSKVHDELSEVVRGVSKVNELNQALIKQSLELVEFDMNLIKSMNSIPQTAEYGKSALSNGGYNVSMQGGFDAKQ